MSVMTGGPLEPLERYLIDTAVSPPPDLVERIEARLLLEPPSTAPRRFLAALRGLDARGMVRGVAENASTAFRPGTRSMVLRAQAMAIVLITLATVGLSGVAGLAATRHAVEELQRGDRRPAQVDAPASVEPRFGRPTDPGDEAVGVVTPPGPHGPPVGLPRHDDPDPDANAPAGCARDEVPASERSARSQADPCPGRAGVAGPPGQKAQDQRGSHGQGPDQAPGKPEDPGKGNDRGNAKQADRKPDQAPGRPADPGKESGRGNGNGRAKPGDRSKAAPRGKATRPDKASTPADSQRQRRR